MLEGIDVYHGDGIVDWEKAGKAGIRFAFCKATEGLTDTDPSLARNLAGMKKAGIIRGVYHYFHVGQSAQIQARRFVRISRDSGYDPRKDMPPCLDLEDRVGAEKYGASIVQAGTALFLGELKSLTGKLPIIYCDKDYWENWMEGMDAYSGHPLWIAEYTKSEEPNLPRGWKSWKFWQYTELKQVDGVSQSVDGNRFYADEESIIKLLAEQ